MKSKERFLAQSYNDAKKDFEFSLSNSKAQCWDWIIITASNERQAESYRIQIEHRIHKGMWPLGSRYMVVSDLNGERVGSGGATLNVLYELGKEIGEENVSRQKILLMHSGGDSKRIPQYSACGKLFSPIPGYLQNGERSTIFDELLIAVSGIPARVSSGMLVLPGDTQMLFNPLQLDIGGCDAAALSIKAGISEGVNHGVFVKGQNGKTADYFLHKKSEQILKEMGAVDSYNNVDIDTGCIWLGKTVITALTDLICKDGAVSEELLHKYVNGKVCLSFYADLVYPLANKSTLESYYNETPEGEFCEELTECRTKLWEVLSGFDIDIVRLTPAKYIHYGTTREYFDMVVWNLDKYKYLGWKKRILTNDNVHDCTINNAVISGSAVIPTTVCIEDSMVGENVVIGENVIISNTELKDINIPSNVVIHCLSTGKGRYICRIYGINDNPKDSADGSFMGTTLRRFIKKYGMDFCDIWDEGVASIWNAKLYTQENTIADAVNSAMLLYKMVTGNADEESVDKWKKTRRYSLNESFNMADISEIIKWQERTKQKAEMHKYLEMIREGRDARQALEESGIDMNDRSVVEEIRKHAEQESFPVNMRLYLALSDICRKRETSGEEVNADEYEDKAYEVIRSSIINAVTERHVWNVEEGFFRKDELEVRLPARVNFCGSPSDAAPYCMEHGGTMLDAAVMLKGERPIRVNVRRLDEPVFILESFDLGDKITIENVDDIRNCSNPFDTFALHKAVLTASGLVTVQDDGRGLKDICGQIGGGLYLSTSVDIPKGSGLGTSSIVAAACIKAVRQILGQAVDDDTIYAQVFLAEQLMTTGGGWQDQVGGLHGGVKYFSSRPGMYQNIKVDCIKLEKDIEKELNDRFALIFSGQRRLARNVLREELNQCIRNAADASDAITRIRQICALMRYELENGNITGFGHLLTEQFNLVKRLDKGASNTCIEYIFDVCDDLIDGKAICGAGGGGFLQVILKKGVTKEQLEKRINSEFSDCGVKVWDCEILF